MCVALTNQNNELRTYLILETSLETVSLHTLDTKILAGKKLHLVRMH